MLNELSSKTPRSRTLSTGSMSTCRRRIVMPIACKLSCFARPPNQINSVFSGFSCSLRCLALCIFVTCDCIDLKLDVQVDVKVTAYGRQTIPDRGVVRYCDPLKNFGGSNHITEMAKPKVIKFCTQGYINSSNRMTYHLQKRRGYGHVTKLCHLPRCSVLCGFVSES